MFSREFVGKKPPEEINVIDKLKELKERTSNILSIIKIKNVNTVYKIKIFIDCLKVSEVLNDKKFVNGFFKFTSKISNINTIENKKYNPPIHWEVDLHNIKLSSRCFIFSKIVNPVDVKPDTPSKYAFKKVML